MSLHLKQSTQVVVQVGPFLDKTDGLTEETGLAGAGTELSKAGAAFGAGPVLGTHDSDGWYPITLTTTHTNTLGTLQLKVHDAATHLPVWKEFEVLAANVYDSLYGAATDKLQVDAVEWLSGTIATPTATGVPEVDVTHWIGTAAATPTTAGIPEVDVTHIGGSAVTAAAGIPEVKVASIAAAAITATSIASDAITDAKVASDVTIASVTGAVGSVTGAVGSVTGNVGGNVTGSVGSLATQAKADVQAEAEEALQTYHLDHLIHTADPGSVVANNSFLAKLVSKSATAAFTDYDNTTDSHQALRDRGDAAWTTATGFSTHSASDVWAAGTRTLTAGTNIALAKGTGVTGFTDIDASGVRTAVGLASANLDTQLGDLPTAAENAAALLDLSNGIETSITPRQAMRLILAAAAGKLSGAATTTIAIRNVGDTKDRITATVDSSGNRSAVTTDGT